MRLSACVLLFAAALSLHGQDPPSWNAPQKPFKIYGNTYWVGTRGLGSVLLASTAGHVLIDGALRESAPLIAANIRELGFRVEDIKLIVNSHVHYDHAGGIAELQRMSGARVVASKWSAEVLRKGGFGKGDPQAGSIEPIAPVANVSTLKDGERLSAGAVTVIAHLTPGHTPGGTSWTWRSCENGRCLDLVYSDSLTAVSAKGFRFTDTKGAVDDFRSSISFLGGVRCDILITTHPEVSAFWQRVDKGALQDDRACRDASDRAREQLLKRLETERQ